MRDEMHDIWGSGAYAWMYMDALAEDQNAFQMLDTDILHAILEIFERRPDQHTANEIAAFLAVTLGDYSAAKKARHAKRQKLKEAAEYVSEILREIDPMPWYRAITGLAPHLGIEDPGCNKNGRRNGLRMLCRIVPNLANAANMWRDDKDDWIPSLHSLHRV